MSILLVNDIYIYVFTFILGCAFRVNGDLGQPQPVYIHRARNTYLSPSGNSGVIRLNANEEIIISCPGSNRLIRHPNVVANVQTAVKIFCIYNLHNMLFFATNKILLHNIN